MHVNCEDTLDFQSYLRAIRNRDMVASFGVKAVFADIRRFVHFRETAQRFIWLFRFKQFKKQFAIDAC